jgi:hypothetical protein
MAFTADTLTEDPLRLEAPLIAQLFDERQELGFTFAARAPFRRDRPNRALRHLRTQKNPP